MGIRFLAITQPFFGQSDWNWLLELRRLLSIDKSWETTVLGLICHFWFCGPYVDPKMGVFPRPPIWSRGLKTQPKIWSTGWTFWVHHYLEILFQVILGDQPPPAPSLKLKFFPRCALFEVWTWYTIQMSCSIIHLRVLERNVCLGVNSGILPHFWAVNKFHP